MTPAPPCHVAKSLPGFNPPLSLTPGAGAGGTTLIELNTMQAGVEQPAQEPVPTDFRLLMIRLNEKYSVPGSRSAAPEAATASAATMRAVFGPRAPMLYAPIPPADAPCAQSMQFTAAAESTWFIVSDAVRHVPTFLNSHHAGSTALAVAMSITISVPTTPGRLAPSSNVPTSWLEPPLLLQAKLRFCTPPSVEQLSQVSPTPGPAAATLAVTARSKPHSRVIFFIATASETSERGCGGGAVFQSRGRDCVAREMGRGHVALPRDMTRHTQMFLLTGRRPRRTQPTCRHRTR